MTKRTLTLIAWWALVVLAVFNALSAVGGGVAMLFTDGLGMPASFLDNGPFTSFVAPAIILAAVVGGTQTVSAVLLLRRRRSALFWNAVAGFALVIWIYVETVMILGFGFLQGLYLVTGLAQLALVIALLGVVSWLPRAPWGAPAVE